MNKLNFRRIGVVAIEAAAYEAARQLGLQAAFGRFGQIGRYGRFDRQIL